MNVLITGANQGIGYYMAVELLDQGYNVTILDLEIDELIKLKEKYAEKIFPIVCDVRNTEGIERAVKMSIELFGSVDIAIHNACRCTFNAMKETKYDVYNDVFDINYYGALRLTKSVLPYMEKAGKGKIMFTSSGVGIMGFINISPYASSKGALESFAKCMSIECQNTGITFHLIHPPLTKTLSAKPLPVPDEFKADPQKVGIGIAKNIHKNKFVVCHSFTQQIQTRLAYLLTLKLGKLMSKMMKQ
jgi:gluconate 5-dehydrogenase